MPGKQFGKISATTSTTAALGSVRRHVAGHVPPKQRIVSAELGDSDHNVQRFVPVTW